MSIYQFKCTSCGAEKDVIRPMRLASHPLFCEECGTQMERQVERPAARAVGFAGKGGGRRDGVNK